MSPTRLIALGLMALLLVGGAGMWLLGHPLQAPVAVAAALAPQKERHALEFLDHLDAGEYEAALAMATPAVRQGLANGKLKQVWESLPAQFGSRQSRGTPRGESIDGASVVSSRLQFGQIALDARVVFDTEDVIAGFWIVPAKEPAVAPAARGESAFEERTLRVGSAEIALPATLTLPHGAGPFAAVVLVHGSGVHDRDETIGPNKPLLDLAIGLAERGIATLRYEKRTRVHPERFAGGDFTVDDETVDDALAAVDILRTQSAIDDRRIFVAGHSLGAMMAPRIGQRDPRIAGLILLAAPAHRLEDIVIRQTRYLAQLQGQDAERIARTVAMLEVERQRIRQLGPASQSVGTPLLFGLPASYWLDLNRYDPIAVARSIKQPLLILQGGRDYQVTSEDEFALWRAAFADNPRVRMIEYPLLGHAFMPGGDPPGPKDYEHASHVDHKVIEDIARWIGSHR